MSLDENDLDEDGDHDEDECWLCIERNHVVLNDCRCSDCCRQMIVEVTLRDAEREPRIQEKGSPIYDDMSGTKELIGWMLNREENNYSCIFLDQQTSLCTIHATRPLCCRVFNCATDYPP